MQRAKFVKEIVVEDPDTGALIELEVYKHENGGMFAVDSSFLDQEAEDILGDGRTLVTDPFYPVLELKDEAELLSLEDNGNTNQKEG